MIGRRICVRNFRQGLEKTSVRGQINPDAMFSDVLIWETFATCLTAKASVLLDDRDIEITQPCQLMRDGETGDAAA